MPEVHTFACSVIGADWGCSYVSAPTASKARYQYLLRVQEAWENIRFQDISVRKVKKQEGPDPYAYVRRVYGVPAGVGKKLIWRGKELEIVRPPDNTSAYVYVWMDGQARPLHPRESGVSYPQEVQS